MFILWQITDEIVLEKEDRLDTVVYNAVSSIQSNFLTKVMIFFTFFGSRSFLLPAYIFIISYYLFFKKKFHNYWGIAAVALSGAGVLMLFKNTLRRKRPSQPLIENITSYSYPSGHSFSAFTFCGILAYLVWRSKWTTTWKWISTIALFLFACTICFSRIYLHVHFASDVLAGICLSLIWLTICYFVLKRLNLIPEIRE